MNVRQAAILAALGTAVGLIWLWPWLLPLAVLGVILANASSTEQKPTQASDSDDGDDTADAWIYEQMNDEPDDWRRYDWRFYDD